MGLMSIKDSCQEFWFSKDLAKQGWGWSLVVTQGQSLSVATHITLTKLSEAEEAAPFMLVNDDAMQHIMNQLWNAGFRPSHEGSEGELQATKKHLEDMRKLVFEFANLTK